MQPYEFKFQNKLEWWLYSSDVMVIIMAGLYTLIGIPSLDVSRTAIDGLGWCMFFVVVGAIIGSAGWLCRAWCRGKLNADALYAENERTSALDRNISFFGGDSPALLLGWNGTGVTLHYGQ